MFGSEILDVAIGVILMFLATSLACSAVNECIEALLKNRARDLERGIRELLSDPGADGLVRQLYSHPLINGLYRGNYTPSSAKNHPSYIPSRTFAIALMDLLQPAAPNASSGASATVPTGRTSLSSMLPASLGRSLIQQFRQTLGGLSASPLRAAMLSLVDAAGDDPVAARQNIEDWYNAAMDRVSGWYKRRTQFILVGIGFAVAVAMNADTLAFARYLSTNKAARDLVVSHAASAVSESPSGTSAGASGAANPGATSKQAPIPADLVPTLEWLNRAGGLPLGWRLPPQPDSAKVDGTLLAEYRIDPQRLPQSLSEGASKLLGFVITALAVSLGAPFWFDVLNKFMVVRSTVKPEEKSREEPGKN